MNKKYSDTEAMIQVIGAVYNNPKILDSEDKYFFNEADFTTDFHRILFEAVHNLHIMGAENINIAAIESYLSDRPAKFAIYKQNNGAEYLTKLQESSSLSSFDYYYNRMKKMSLLRGYDNIGMDLNWLYDVDNILDIKKKQAQEDWLDHTSLEEIADIIDSKIQEVRDSYVNDNLYGTMQLGDGILELLDKLEEVPDIGCPLFGPYINTVTRGARLKKFYLRSAATGVGKTRTLMADACHLACTSIWSKELEQWVPLTTRQPVLFISTELELQELQTLALSFISGVNENHIVTNRYDFGEYERVRRAAEIIQGANLIIEILPDFSLKDIENTIKRNIRDHKCLYIFLDYIHTSMKILEEITRRSGGIKLREDNVLFMISVKLKDICTKYGVFICSATQLNMDYQHSKTPDQNLLRGAKSIADKVDVGMILLDVTKEDLESLADILGTGGFETPNVKCSIYKNRGNGHKGIYLWMKADKATCRFETMFATGWNYELTHINETKIIVEE